MYLPQLPKEDTRKSVQMDFRGYNHNLYVDDNEFYDEENVTGKYYPVMSPRGPYYSYYSGVTPPEDMFRELLGMIGNGKGNLLYVDVDEYQHVGLYLNGTKIGEIQPYFEKRTLIPYGGYVAIFPDMMLYNWSTGTLEYMAVDKATSNTDTATYDIINKDGSSLPYTASSSAPANPSDGDYWLDTSSNPDVLKRWSGYTSMWVSVPTTYVGITISGFSWPVSVGDGIKLSFTQPSPLNAGNYIVQNVVGDTLIVTGIISGSYTSSPAGVRVYTEIPSMNYVCSHNNRLWGCSNYKHEIYACKLGDPKNWFCYAGISTDSYAVTIPEETNFTGCASFHGSILFFKERKIYKIYGTKPSNFQLSEISCAGVAPKCSGSICTINEYMYYAGSDGIYMYDGSIPRLISGGTLNRDIIIREANGGTDGVNYFVFIKSETNNEWDSAIYEYNGRTGVWSKNKETYAWNFIEFVPGTLAFISETPLLNDAEQLLANTNISGTTVTFDVVNPYTPNLFAHNTIVDNDPRLVGRKVVINGIKRTIVSNTAYQFEVDGIVAQMSYLPVDGVERIICFTKPIKNNMPNDGPVPWMLETGDISRFSTNRGMAYDINRHYLSRIQVRTELEAGSTFHIAMQYDHGSWEEVYSQIAPTAEDRYTYLIPIIPHRADTIRMKLYGEGGCKIFAIGKLYEQGSDI